MTHRQFLRRVLRLFAAVLFFGFGDAAVFAAADPNKVVRYSFPASEDTLDPVRVSNLYSNTINEAIFERLLTYDYLARPARVVPMTAESMPTVSDAGRTYLFKIRKGIFFSPDPVFGGKKRELVAQDYVFSFMRFMDPKLRSPWQFMLAGKIVGLDQLGENAKKTGRFDYNARVPGLEIVDSHTLRLRLNEPDYNFTYVLAHVPFGAVAREVVEAYGDDIVAHPVGTGAYRLKEWTRRSKIVLEANPLYRGLVWNFQPSADAWDQQLVRDMQGKTMPQIGRIEINIMEEPQSRWLAFKNKELDYLDLPREFASEALEQGKLKAALVGEGITRYQATDPEIVYTYFNFRDPVVGGLGKEKIALRRAIALSYDVNEEIRIIRRGLAVKAQMLIPPGVVGHNPAYRSSVQYDPQLANRLLDRYGYRRGADGYRQMPDGSPLLLKIQGDTTGSQRSYDELWKKSLQAIGIRVEFPSNNYADNLKSAKACQLQMWGSAWTADYPDGDNFMQLLYGPNSGQANYACYASPAFDTLYERAKKMPDSAERNTLYEQMNRQMEADTIWSLHISRLRNDLIRPWVKGFKKHPILHAEWLYMDIDLEARKK